MKRFVLNVFLFLIALISSLNQVSAQDVYSNYTMSFFNNKEYQIGATEPEKNGNFNFYIFCESMDRLVEDVGFRLESKNVQNFIDCLQAFVPKFEEWSRTAKENDVKSYDKDFDVTFKSITTFFKYGKNYHFCTIRPRPYFKVTSDGECLVVFNSGKLQSSSNRFIDMDGLALVFNSVPEIEDFIEAINPIGVYEKNEKKTSTDDLFK